MRGEGWEEEENIWQLVNICSRLLSSFFTAFLFFFWKTTEENPSKNKHIVYGIHVGVGEARWSTGKVGVWCGQVQG